MKIEQRNSGKSKTLNIICEKEKAELSYQVEMLLANRIPYILSPVKGIFNGREMLIYDLAGLSSIETRLKEHPADSAFLKKLMLSLAGAYEALDEFLISREYLVISAQTVFITDEGRMLFVCFPYEKGDPARMLASFGEYILSKLDHSDRNAVTVGHRFFGICMKNEADADALRAAVSAGAEPEALPVPEALSLEEPIIEEPVKNSRKGVVKRALYSLIGLKK